MRLELWEEYKSIIKEVEPYQKWAKSQNKRFKKIFLIRGGFPILPLIQKNVR